MEERKSRSDASADFACEIVRRVIGCVVDVYDRDGRQNAVDLRITHGDGRLSYGEVTRIVAQDAREIESILAREDWTWPSVGRWWWTVAVAPGVDLRQLRRRYPRIIRSCERLGVQSPGSVPWGVRDADQDFTWLATQDATFHGHTGVTAVRDDGTDRGVMITPASIGGIVDKSLHGLADALTEVYQLPHVEQRVAKLVAAGGDGAHLFLIIDDDGVPFSVFYALAFGSELPSEPPPLPDGVTDLWLAPRWSRRVLRYAASRGWTQHHPYDAAVTDDD